MRYLFPRFGNFAAMTTHALFDQRRKTILGKGYRLRA